MKTTARHPLRKVGVGVAVAAVVGALAAAGAYARPEALERAENWTFDARVRHTAPGIPVSPDVVLVDITDQDLKDVERDLGISWPWPRELFSVLVGVPSRAGARVVILDWLFQDAGKSAEDLVSLADAMAESKRVVFGLELHKGEAQTAPQARFGAVLLQVPTRAEAEKAALLARLWAPHVLVVPTAKGFELVLGAARAEEVAAVWRNLQTGRVLASLGLSDARPDQPPPVRPLTPAEQALEGDGTETERRRDAFAVPTQPGLHFPHRVMEPPVAPLAAVAARLGNVSQDNDFDGVIRHHLAFVESGGLLYPSLPLAGLLASDPSIVPRFEGQVLWLGDRRVPLDEQGRWVLRYTAQTHEHHRANALLQAQAALDEGKVPELDLARFKGKLVVVSAQAAALRDLRVSPVRELHPGAEINALALDNLLSGRVVERAPRWADALFAFLLATLLGGLVALIWHQLANPWAALAVAASSIILGLLGATLGAAWLLSTRDVWLGLFVPAVGALASTSASLLATNALERKDRRFAQEALGRYTSPEIVRELMAHPEKLSLEWGETREITVYFSDIANFTSFSELLPPERLVALLNDYLTHMTDIVLEHGGVVDKYIGDAIMAFWGAPLDEARHARQAVLAALAMRSRCEALRQKWLAEFGTLVIARAGVNTGVAVAGNMGSRHKFNYTVMGDTVNLASRLEGANKPYGTTLMISESTYAQVKDDVDVRELDLLAVKGKAKPVTVYEVLARKGAVPPTVAEAMAHYTAALALYRGRDFVGAQARFGQALGVLASDGPSQTYLARCAHFLQEPPLDDWDGVWHMKEK
jgi:adenylate cyclase